jgi:hypothetical protein
VRDLLYDRTHGWHSTPLETIILVGILIGIVVAVRSFSGTPVGIIVAVVGFIGYVFDAHFYIPGAVAIAVLCTWFSARRADPGAERYRRSWPALLLDMSIAGGGFFLYELGRIATRDGEETALANAERLMSLQRWLRLPSEVSLQRLILENDTLLRLVNETYSYLFLSTVIGSLIWLYLNNLPIYRRVRNALGLATLISLGIFAAFPMAPPRLVPASQLIDSHARVGLHHGYVNQFAAIPSLHIGWMALTGWGMWASLRGIRGFAIAVAPPSVMMIAVVGSGNHFWLDGVVGAGICLAAVAAVVPRPVAAPVSFQPRIAAAARRLTVGEVLGERERVRNGLILLCGLLLFTFTGRLLDPVFTPYWGYLAGQVALLALAIVVFEARAVRGPLLSASTYVIICVAMAVDVFGTAGHMYDHWDFYDKIVHLMGTAAVTAVVHDIFQYRGWGRKWANANALGIMAATIGIVVGIIWELYEVFGDVIFATARSGGMIDTAYDITFDTIGAITAVLILSWNWSEAATGDSMMAPLDPADPNAAARELAGTGN